MTLNKIREYAQNKYGDRSCTQYKCFVKGAEYVLNRRWIKGKNPTKDITAIVVADRQDPVIATYDAVGKEWNISDKKITQREILGWMPIPEFPQKEDEQ